MSNTAVIYCYMHVENDTDQQNVSLCVVLKEQRWVKDSEINSSERKFKRVDDWIFRKEHLLSRKLLSTIQFEPADKIPADI